MHVHKSHDHLLNEWYGKYYSKINISAREKSTLYRLMHLLLEKSRLIRSRRFTKILEVGANSGQHVAFVKKTYETYVASDLRMPEFSVVDSLESKFPGLRFEIADVERLPYHDGVFDRVVVTCLLHHLRDLDSALLEIRRVTNNNGVISILLPHDPGNAYRFFKKATTYRTAKRAELGDLARLVHAIEHRNHYLSIIELIAFHFRHDLIRTKQFPLPIKTYNFNLISRIEVIIKK